MARPGRSSCRRFSSTARSSSTAMGTRGPGRGQSGPGRRLDPITGAWLLDHGYALAGISSYATTGWALQQAIPDQIDTLNVFDKMFGRAAAHDRVGATRSGGSSPLGCFRTILAASAALPIVTGSSLAASPPGTRRSTPEFAIQQLLDPSLQVVYNITNPTGNLVAAEGAVTTAFSRPRRGALARDWQARSPTSRDGSRRRVPSRPRTTSPTRRRTSSSSSPRSTARSCSTSKPSSKAAPAATRPGTRA